MTRVVVRAGLPEEYKQTILKWHAFLEGMTSLSGGEVTQSARENLRLISDLLVELCKLPTVVTGEVTPSERSDTENDTEKA